MKNLKVDKTKEFSYKAYDESSGCLNCPFYDYEDEYCEHYGRTLSKTEVQCDVEEIKVISKEKK